MKTENIRRVSPYAVSNLQQILSGFGDWWDAHLLRLITKGDGEEFAKLEQVYPAHTDLVTQYRRNGTGCPLCSDGISEWCPSCRTYFCDGCFLEHKDKEMEQTDVR